MRPTERIHKECSSGRRHVDRHDGALEAHLREVIQIMLQTHGRLVTAHFNEYSLEVFLDQLSDLFELLVVFLKFQGIGETVHDRITR